MKRIPVFDKQSPRRIVYILLIGAVAIFGLIEARMWGIGVPQPRGHVNESEVEYSELELKLKPLHKPIGRARHGDWRLSFIEPRQTFKAYLEESPIRPTEKRSKLYVLPLGGFTSAEQKIFDLTAEYLGLCYSLPVEVMETLPLSEIPETVKRVHPEWGDRQILTSYLLNMLRNRLPNDAAAMICLTSEDLWPGEGWNYVFGQASLQWRVGVWSMHRFGDPQRQYDKCLMRTLKTAAHETGHMFGMLHCTAWNCGMCGSNNLDESDRRPLWFCHECVAKVIDATGADPVKRFEKLGGFCKANGLKTEAEFFAASAAVLRD